MRPTVSFDLNTPLHRWVYRRFSGGRVVVMLGPLTVAWGGR